MHGQPDEEKKQEPDLDASQLDLPEALVLYGLDTVIDFISSPSHPTVRPGVLRLIDEARELAVPTFILSESLTTNELARAVESVEPSFQQLSSNSRIHYQSGLEEFVIDGNGGEDGFSPDRFVGEGIGHAPCPAALYDAVNSVSILPKGFGGADGFGVKNWEAARAPLPQHCVVFVCGDSDGNRSGVLDRSDGSGSISRDRCIAARYAGMRSIYIESEGRPCTADDVADGVVGSLGTEEDWEIVTLDDVSSPGSFWVNMMLAKDLDGMGVNTETVIEEFIERRRGKNKTAPSYFARNDPEPDEDELAKILADLESL
eukprot:CAMPEP_0194319150 /NCGR_PEP_ID=MMETSP0171-20130528/15633_1 /TAXON_ID=218684 /ORGANISM="Corethron pennatum, Strain L29A3" /LENGTH=315 /DNA_ID=CAMNT_0039076265 /DNA_START=256 /DNA_END=1204 /DNA_ORIENTATION=-